MSKEMDDFDAQDWASFQEEFGVEEEEIYFNLQDISNDDDEVIPNMELVYAGYL